MLFRSKSKRGLRRAQSPAHSSLESLLQFHAQSRSPLSFFQAQVDHIIKRSTDDYSIPLLIALITSWLGDVLLIPKGHKWFTMGGISFMVSHFFFIFAYVGRIDFSKIPWFIVIPIALIYYGISLKIIFMVKDNTPKIMIPPMYFYLLCNSTMNVFALMQFMSNPNIGSFIALVGAILFFVSDCTLFLVRYSKKPEMIYKKHFTVMFTYIVGEFLITLGILLLAKGG